MLMKWPFRSSDKKSKDEDSDKEKRSSFPSIPKLEVTPEREEAIIDYVAKKVMELKMEVPALMLLIPLKPVAPIVGQVQMLSFAPFMELFGLRGFEYAAFLSKSENIDRLIKKIQDESGVRL